MKCPNCGMEMVYCEHRDSWVCYYCGEEIQ
jgi:ribosomal protein S27AE